MAPTTTPSLLHPPPPTAPLPLTPSRRSRPHPPCLSISIHGASPKNHFRQRHVFFFLLAYPFTLSFVAFL